jgi:hypothetical protein
MSMELVHLNAQQWRAIANDRRMRLMRVIKLRNLSDALPGRPAEGLADLHARSELRIAPRVSQAFLQPLGWIEEAVQLDRPVKRQLGLQQP